MRLVDDAAWTVMTLVAEAGGEPYAGKLGVAEVIRNRMARKYTSDGTVVGTVLAAEQFSCWSTRDPNRLRVARLEAEDPVVVECVRAWREAVFGKSNTVLGAICYYNPKGVTKTPRWATVMREVAVLGGHHFFVA